MIPHSIIPASGGSVLLYGRQGHYQHGVCVDLALSTALATGGPTVVLTGRDDQSQLPGLVIAWRNARNIPVGTRLRILGISAKAILNAKDPITECINETGAGVAPKLIVYDQSLDTREINPGSVWWKIARDLSGHFRCPVLSCAHTGTKPGQPNCDVDVSVHCSAFYDRVRRTSLAVTLSYDKPARNPINLLGNSRCAGNYVAGGYGRCG